MGQAWKSGSCLHSRQHSEIRSDGVKGNTQKEQSTDRSDLGERPRNGNKQRTRRQNNEGGDAQHQPSSLSFGDALHRRLPCDSWTRRRNGIRRSSSSYQTYQRHPWRPCIRHGNTARQRRRQIDDFQHSQKPAGLTRSSWQRNPVRQRIMEKRGDLSSRKLSPHEFNDGETLRVFARRWRVQERGKDRR